MLVRVIRDCYQPLTPGGPNKCISLGSTDRDIIVEWEGEEDQELPGCFEAVRSGVSSMVQAEPLSPPPNLMSQNREAQVLEALNRMDHEEDDQWTSQGLPLVETVSDILDEMGYEAKTDRAEINVANPGFARET